MKKYVPIALIFTAVHCLYAANPVFRAADPHAILIDGTVYVYPTSGAQNQFFVFTSSDLVTWKRHPAVLDFNEIPWIPSGKHAWAPAVIENNGRYYFYYSVGPKHSRIGAAVGTSPLGPFADSGRALLSDEGKPGFEAIDPMVFCDPNTNTCYLYAGGSAGATLRGFEMNPDMISLAREVEVQTPKNFTEGAFMHVRNGTYYLSYSHGSYRHSSYSVHYATSATPTGPWNYQGPILTSDNTYKGPGHHSFFHDPVNDQWYIVYHRWENVSGDGPYSGSRKTAIETIEYESDGRIKPVTMTAEGVGPTKFQ